MNYVDVQKLRKQAAAYPARIQRTINLEPHTAPQAGFNSKITPEALHENMKLRRGTLFGAPEAAYLKNLRSDLVSQVTNPTPNSLTDNIMYNNKANAAFDMAADFKSSYADPFGLSWNINAQKLIGPFYRKFWGHGK